MTDQRTDQAGEQQAYHAGHLIQVPMRPDVRTVLVTGGYIRQRQLGGTLILRLLDLNAVTIDAWYADCNGLMTHWGRGKRLRYLHDIRQVQHVTPHALDRVTRILSRMRVTPVSDGRGAILANHAPLVSLLQTTLKSRRFSTWNMRIFHDEDAALRWLAE